MSFNTHPQLSTTPEARKAQVDLVRQEFADAQSDGSIVGELFHIAWRSLTLPWRLLRGAARLLVRLASRLRR